MTRKIHKAGPWQTVFDKSSGRFSITFNAMIVERGLVRDGKIVKREGVAGCPPPSVAVEALRAIGALPKPKPKASPAPQPAKPKPLPRDIPVKRSRRVKPSEDD